MDSIQFLKAVIKAENTLRNSDLIVNHQNDPDPYLYIALVNRGPQKKQVIYGNYVFQGTTPTPSTSRYSGQEIAEDLFSKIEFFESSNTRASNHSAGSSQIVLTSDGSNDHVIIIIGGVVSSEAERMIGVIWGILQQNHIVD